MTCSCKNYTHHHELLLLYWYSSTEFHVLPDEVLPGLRQHKRCSGSVLYSGGCVGGWGVLWRLAHYLIAPLTCLTLYEEYKQHVHKRLGSSKCSILYQHNVYCSMEIHEMHVQELQLLDNVYH